jgi:hypothetical protein
MGRIADLETTERVDNNGNVWVNRVDAILESECEDDEDRVTLLAWLRDPKWSGPALQRRLKSIGIGCSDRAIQEWRRAQKEGTGRSWE